MKLQYLLLGGLLGLSATAFAQQEGEISEEERQALMATAQEVNESCPLGEMPSIPDGADSSEDELLAAQRELKTFMGSAETFLGCLEEVEGEWGDDASDNELAILTAMHNRVVENMQSLADDFNAAVREYKAQAD